MEAHVEEEEGATVEATEKKLTDKEIVAYSITFLLAGYETTSNTLAYISYLLALNPAVQKQLQTEIDEYFSDNPVTKHITQSHYEIIVLCTVLASYPHTQATFTCSHGEKSEEGLGSLLHHEPEMVDSVST